MRLWMFLAVVLLGLLVAGTNLYINRLQGKVVELERIRDRVRKEYSDLNAQLDLYRKFVRLFRKSRELPPLESAARFFETYSCACVWSVLGVPPRIVFESKASTGLVKASEPVWFLKTPAARTIAVEVSFDAGNSAAPAASVAAIVRMMQGLSWFAKLDELTIKKTVVKMKYRIAGKVE